MLGFSAGAGPTPDFRLEPAFGVGPVIDLSNPDLFAGCGSNGAEKESCIAANPINPKNLVAAWIGGRFKGIGAAVTLDGGRRWRLPGTDGHAAPDAVDQQRHGGTGSVPQSPRREEAIGE